MAYTELEKKWYERRKSWIVPWKVTLVSILLSEVLYIPFYLIFFPQDPTGWVGIIFCFVVPLFVAYPVTTLISSLVKDVEKLNTELVDENEQKEKLLGIIGHDIRGPLAGLMGLIELLDSKDLNQEEFTQWVSDLKPKLHFTKDTLDKLVYWAKLRMSSSDVSPTPFKLEEIEPALFEYIELFADKSGVTLEINWSGNIYVQADKHAVMIAVSNILHNAIKFSPSHSTVTISSRQGVQEVTIFIEDQGPGIDEDILSSLFQSPLNSNDRSDGAGMGLGLFLTREFIEMSQGSISAENRLTGGAQFSITLKSV